MRLLCRFSHNQQLTPVIHLPALSPFISRLTQTVRLRVFMACLTALLLTLGLTALAQTSNNSIDATGDIAFVAYGGRSNGVAGFAFVLLDNCPNNQWFVSFRGIKKAR
jgi:hypothetical protein